MRAMSVPRSSSITSESAGGSAPFRLGRQPALDGIRAVGITTFIVYHGQILWHRSEDVDVIFPGAFLWLDMFFVLSAFLITSLLIEEGRAHRSIGLRNFWVRRALRLLPGFALVMGFTAFWLLTFAPEGAWRTESWKEWLFTLLYVNNWWHVFNPEAFPHYVSHAWSLSMEEQFYVVAPFMVLAVFKLRWSAWRASAAFLALAGASGLWMVVLEGQGATVNRLYYGTDTRAQAFLVGVALGFAASAGFIDRARGALRYAMWVAVPLALVMLQTFRLDSHSREPYRGVFTLACLTWATIIVGLVAAPRSRLARVLSTRPFVYTGRISYGLYLWHWPVMLVTDQYLHSWPEWPLIALQVAITLVVAAVSWRWVEAPVLRHASRFRASRAPAPGVAAPATAG
jgi:peptidoglycan/LPS O-acetylase OafA/YrhL